MSSVPNPVERQSVSARSLFRNILFSSGLYSIALIGQRLIGVLLLSITTRFLETSDYGVLELLEQTTSVITLLLGLNLSAALGYFYFHEDSAEGRRSAIGTTLYGSAIVGLVIALAGWAASRGLSKLVFRNATYAPYLVLVFLGLPIALLAEAGMTWLRVENRQKAFVIAALGRNGLSCFSAIVFVALLRWHVWGMLYTNLLAASCAALGLVFYCYKVGKPLFEMKLLLRMMRFSLPIGISTIAVFIIHFGDRFVLTRYLPLSEIGLYGLAYKLGMLISVVQASFETYWSAQVYQIVRREDARVVVARVFSYLVLAMTFSGLALMVATRPGLRILAPPSYAGAAVLVPIILAAYILRTMGDFFRTFFYVTKHPPYDAVCNWIGAGVCVAGYLILIPIAGTKGAAFATLLAFFVIGVISAVWVYQVRPYQLEGTRLAKIGLATGVSAVGYYLLPVPGTLIAQIGWGILLLLAQPLVLILLGFLTPGEWEIVRSLPGRLRS